ncbi:MULTISPECIES: AraC family transcriptional regulator [Pseudomonas]|uniref:AraC family transcriptional regulator n=1 Tax=Pseudomonas monteilii TaxID=76759 RepID=A0A6G6UI77_9PSED|nr:MULTISPECIES: AraC family transcriptional regulator [Pseudomonas]MBA6138389.1 AraC family transcriptional regulator [Pseudomonas monteilii]MCA4077140.1 AraC family transcriptional regulator [Pseudomonas kurunegalensis]MCE0908979.1 AraC family transcriptional regulator [Pseudomonas kurunegalensis]MDT3747522.1 AraC family transcriptional regulator [Pseudomonas kurunegalensis]MVF47994.1 AraC family transcriptional regulator [Pseudomonas monteilii]
MHGVAATLHNRCAELGLAQQWMSEICGPHQLRSRHPEQLCFSHLGTRLPALGTVLGRIAYGTEVNIDIRSLDAYSISLPLRGRQRLRSGRDQVRSDAACGLVVSPLEAHSLELGGDCEKLQVVIRRQALEEVAEALLQRPLAEPIRFRAEMDTGCAAVAAWWLSIRQVLEHWPQMSALYGQPRLARDMECLLIRGLLLAQPSNYSAELEPGAMERVPEYLVRARQFLHQHARETLRLDDLEQVAGVSREKLYEAFRRHHGLTPMAYLKHHRLAAARSALLNGGASASVSSVALEWGFSHLGRFASDYRKAFGESPSATLARLR